MGSDTLREELKRLFGHSDFRPGQREIVDAALAGRDTLALLPTGGGKSLTYQLPALLLPGATLVLSPLIALMKDQVENLPPAVAERVTLINSTLEPAEMTRRLTLLRSGQIKVVYAAPERLRQPTFLHALRQAGVSLVVIDEAHCISQWGHDFRPDYRAVGRVVEALSPRSVLAVTATATPEVADDIERQLGRPLHRLVRPTFRQNLFLSSVRVAGEDEKLRTTLEICRSADGVGLVYAGSREKCEQLARMLARYGVDSGYYHAGLPPEERAAAQDRFMSGAVRVMAATVAFGMGVDKSDIRFLVHFHPSRTLENYYQEAGRAGRDGQLSHCVLLHSASDAASARRRLKEDMLTLDRVRQVYQAVRERLLGQGRRVAPVSLDGLVQAVDGDEALVRSALPLLEEAGLLLRSVDLPRRLTLYPRRGEGEYPGTFDPKWLKLAEVAGEGGDFDPLLLADTLEIPPGEVESVALSAQEAGLLTCRPGPREMLLELLPPPAAVKDRLAEMLAHRARGEGERMEAMVAYSQEKRCRHEQIARYFGDRWPRLSCGACDICERGIWQVAREAGRGERTESGFSAAPDALSALQVIADLAAGNYPFAVGKAGLVKILRGTPDAPVRPQRTQRFGVMAECKKAEVERLVEALVEQGYLRRDEGDEYRRLYLEATGRQALAEGVLDIEWRSPPGRPARLTGKAGEPDTAAGGEADPGLLSALKSWRWELATAGNVPPYVIFPDRTLLEIAATHPTNEFDLLEINGIGPAKAAKYGDAVLEVVRRHREGKV